MKYSTAMLSLAAVATAQPTITNVDFNVVEGQPFTITFDGCEGGCTILLSNGPSDDLQEVQELTSSANGGEFTFTPESIPSDQYAFEIINNESGENNYSLQFEYEGEGEPEVTSSTVIETTFTSAVTATVPVTETSTSTPEVTLTNTSVATLVTTVSSATETAETATATDDEEATATDDAEASATATPTTIPEGAGAAIGSPLTLVVAAVAGLLMFN